MEEGKGDMVLCAGTGMNAAVRDGEESYFVFGDYIEESMQGEALWQAVYLKKKRIFSPVR